MLLQFRMPAADLRKGDGSKRGDYGKIYRTSMPFMPPQWREALAEGQPLFHAQVRARQETETAGAGVRAAAEILRPRLTVAGEAESPLYLRDPGEAV